jgi:hypothetical protein
LPCLETEAGVLAWAAPLRETNIIKSSTDWKYVYLHWRN